MSEFTMQPPGQSAEAEDVQPTRVVYADYAGFWKRFGAAFVDMVLLGVCNSLFTFAVALMFGSLDRNQFVPSAPGIVAIVFLVKVIAGWLYYALMESSASGATLGKRAMNLRVTDIEGNRISFGRATGRYLGKYLSALTLMIGFIMAAFTEKRQALHDLIAGTLVIDMLSTPDSLPTDALTSTD